MYLMPGGALRGGGGPRERPAGAAQRVRRAPAAGGGAPHDVDMEEISLYVYFSGMYIVYACMCIYTFCIL